METFLGSKTWFVGLNITVADFVLYELFDQLRVMDSKALDAYPKIRSFVSRFEALPKIAAFLGSDLFFKRPLNNKNAAFKWPFLLRS